MVAVYGRLIIQGAFPGGEIWNCTSSWLPTGAAGSWDQAIGDAQVAAAASVVMPTQVAGLLSTSVTVTGMRWEMRDEATDALLGFSQYLYGTPVVGTTTPRCPPQTAVVISLRTLTPGATGRGRIFWPGVGASISSTTLTLTTTQAPLIVADFKTYLAAIGNAMKTAGSLTALDLAVRSQKAHTEHKVTKLMVGTVVDTVRRRRNKLPETYSSVTYP